MRAVQAIKHTAEVATEAKEATLRRNESQLQEAAAKEEARDAERRAREAVQWAALVEEQRLEVEEDPLGIRSVLAKLLWVAASPAQGDVVKSIICQEPAS